MYLFLRFLVFALRRLRRGEATLYRRRFQLPREGKTILVRNQRSGKILRKLTWNCEKFQDEK
jgi:hypothetical protein